MFQNAARIPVPSLSALHALVASAGEDQASSRRIATSLDRIQQAVDIQRRIVRQGDFIYQAGKAFTHLFVVNTGMCKVVNLSRDGREQIVALKYRGDWMGFDGIAEHRHDCDAIAMDTGEVWSIAYDALLQAGVREPALMAELHRAMSREIARDRGSLISVCTLPADARVADFLCNWADALACRGLRTDQVTMRMTRAEIGNYLGLTLETVSRALSRLDREGLIRFADKGRRELQLPDLAALGEFVRQAVEPASATLQ
ncbi:MAG TPA: helix-turn-helix domain-containing protein [Burkholderiaceae bacterium]